MLVDSEGLANEQLRLAFAAHGLDMPLSRVIETFVGLSMPRVVEIAEEMLDHKLPTVFLDRLQEKTFDCFRHSLQAVAGVHETLKALSEMPVKICVASSGSFEKMALTLGLTGLEHYFTGNIFNASQVKRGKPYPDLFLFAAAQMDVDPARCLVVEDSLPGVQGAVAAGMAVLAYSVRGQDKYLATAGGMVMSDMGQVVKYVRD